MASPFDPFDASFDDDFSSARTIASKMSKTSKASKSSNKRRTTTKSPALEVVQEGPSSPRALPPRLVVKLALYEDISSTAIVGFSIVHGERNGKLYLYLNDGDLHIIILCYLQNQLFNCVKVAISIDTF
mmetsp:Transcript_33819/g.73137  ORF Transcript_33819/g.73137 Transcript_33819/m.73137 type:complete len:129 (-) Transcript_33819:8-394(-)